MPNYTTNYKLKKPLGNENYNIEDFNGNMDTLDTKVKEIETKANNITVPVTSVNTKTGAVVLNASDVKMSDGTTIEAKVNAKADSFNKSDSVSSTSSTDVATSKAVKQAYDLANSKQSPITISSSTTSTSTTTVANSCAVKQVYDLANTKQSVTDNNLNTTNKTITGAINEVFQLGNNVKSNMVNALLQVDNSLPITTNSSWENVISSIGSIKNYKKATGSGAAKAMPSNKYEVQVSGLDFTPNFVYVQLVFKDDSGYILSYDHKIIFPYDFTNDTLGESSIVNGFTITGSGNYAPSYKYVAYKL